MGEGSLSTIHHIAPSFAASIELSLCSSMKPLVEDDSGSRTRLSVRIKRRVHPELARLLRRVAWRIGLATRVFLEIFSLRVLTVAELNSSNSSVLHEHSSSVAVFPEFLEPQSGDFSASIIGHHRVFSPRAFCLEGVDVAINYKFACVIQDRSLLLLPRYTEKPWNLIEGLTSQIRGGILAQEGMRALVWARRSSELQPQGLYIGHRAIYNWSHWLVDFLPALHFANQIESIPADAPLIFPEDSLPTGAYMESLGLFLRERPMVCVPIEAWTKFLKLYWVEPPVIGSPVTVGTRLGETTTVNVDLFRQYRSVYFEQFWESKDSHGQDNGPVVFVMRRSDKSRRYNQEDVYRVISDFGVKPVYAEDLSLEEKVRIFSGARAIVGENGSGMANLLFASRGTKVLTWWGGSEGLINHTATISQVTGLEVHGLHPSAITKMPGGDYSVDLNSLRIALGNVVGH